MPLLPRWAELNPSVVLRRVRIPDETPMPVQDLSPRAPPPPKESHPEENELTLVELTDLEEALGEGTSPWEEGELETVLDGMIETIEGDPLTEPAGDNQIELPERRPIEYPIYPTPATSAASIRAGLNSIRSELYDATEMITGAQRHLDMVETILALEEDYYPLPPTV